jgi:transmembrane sensor
MSYSNYSAEDFALDDEFQKWVLDTDEQTNEFWSQWIANNPHKIKEINEARELVKLAGLSPDREATAAFLDVWEKVKNHAEQEQVQIQQPKPALGKYIAWAAAFAAVALAAVYLFRSSPQQNVEYQTAYGEVKEFILADGSHVTLNANSKLSCIGDWGEAREVLLEGEAFFDVVHSQDDKEFVVKTVEDIAVQVLGTEFNINTRNNSFSVYLQSGKIELNAASQTMTLKPGDFAEFDRVHQKINITEAGNSIENELAWKNNFFIYNDTPLSEIVEDIEDNFGMEVLVADSSLNDKRVTVKVSRKEVNVLLQVLAQTLEIQIEQNKNQIFISPYRKD